jgi:hypothetical protein
MRKYASSLNLLWGPFKFIRNIIHNIFSYLSCHECDTSDNRMLLRNLYNAGQIDEGKYHHFRERCLNDSFDPEEIHNSL